MKHAAIWLLFSLSLGGCPSDDEPVDTSTTDTAPNVGEDAVADATSDAETGPDGPQNLAQVLGYPWTAADPPAHNADWQAACESEIPYGASVTRPSMPATGDNCGGNPTKCGPNGGQDCAAEPALSQWLHRKTVDLASYPEATCGDGSPAVIEIRPGTGAGADRWLIWFKGGSGCRTQHLCAKRWCGNQSGSSYRADIMSTDWNGDGVVDKKHCVKGDVGSAVDPNLEGNPFAQANVVKILYCGSDNHMGRAAVTYEDDDADGDGVDRGFRLNHHGRHIVEAVVDMLKAPLTSDDGAVTLPSVANATGIVISGSSAGMLGAVQNIDAVASELRLTATGAEIRGFLDANAPPSDEVIAAAGVYLDSAFDGMTSAPGVDLAQWRQQRDAESWATGWFAQTNAFVDESCVAYVEASGGALGMGTCTLTTSLMLAQDAGKPLLETESFVRFDLGDGVIGGIYKPCKHPVTEEDCYTPNHSMLAATSSAPTTWLTLLDSTDHNRATMEQLFNSGGSVTGIFAPACGTHTGVVNSNFSVQKAADYDGTSFAATSVSAMQALAKWLTTSQPVRVIDASKSSADTPSSVCN